MEAGNDYYEILGVLPSIDEAALLAVYRALLKKYHPDIFKGEKREAEKRTREIIEAFSVVSDPLKQRDYDKTRRNDRTLAKRYDTQKRLTIARALLDAQQRHDLQSLLACFGPEPTLEFTGDKQYVGIKRIHKIYGELSLAFPDLTIELINEHVGKDSVVMEFVMRGTHRQQWLGMAPRERTLALPVCSVFLFDSRGRLSAQRMYFDRNLAIIQLTSGLLR
jgi:curved DNA-binding protein CbpA